MSSLSKNKLYFNGEVNQDSISELIRKTHGLPESNPVDFFISSGGGDIGPALGAYDILSTNSNTLTTFAYGPVMSSGVILFCSGEKRFAYEHTQFLVHEMSVEKEVVITKLIRMRTEEIV